MKVIIALIQAGTLIAGLMLAGCGGETYNYVPEHELKPGPGLVTGAAGELTIFGSGGKEKQQHKAEDTKQSP